MVKPIKTRKRNYGFTLAELLIVVAIIVILAFISIPIFSGQLDKVHADTCEENRKALQHSFAVERMGDPKSANSEILIRIQQKVIEGNGTGCPCEDSVYYYEYFTEDGTATNGTSNDAVKLVVRCSIEGHGTTALQQAKHDIQSWIEQYNEAYGNNPSKMNSSSVIAAYVKEHGGSHLLTATEFKELFGDRTIAGNFNYNSGDLYLRPMGVVINGKLQNVQYVARWNQMYGNANENLRTYAFIVNGKTYAALNDKNEVIGPAHLSGTYINVLVNAHYNSVDEFIAAMTRNGQFRQISP